MRKASIIAMAALALLTAQCKKNEPKPEEKVMVPITGSVDFGGSKTEITTSGMINPKDGDVIYIYNNNGDKVGSMTCTAQTGQQFTCSGEIVGTCLGQPCTFMYLGTGSTDADGNPIDGTNTTISFADQRWVSVSNDNKISGLEKFHVGSCQATVSETGTVTLPMATKMSIAYFQLKDQDGQPVANQIVTISGVLATAAIDKENGTISVNGTGNGPGNITVSTDAEGKFYMALVPQSGSVTFTFAVEGYENATNVFPYGIRECSFYSNEGSGNPLPVTVTKLTPKFTVGMDNGNPRRVEFSPGNLYWDGTESKFKFESNQWDYRVDNIRWEEDCEVWIADWNQYHVSHFFWSTSAEKAVENAFDGEQTMSVYDNFFTNSDVMTANPDFHVNGETGENQWRMLSIDEWSYLIGESSPGRNESLSKWSAVTFGVSGPTVSGLIIMPDGYDFSTTPLTDGDGTTSYERWQALEASGAVFLPASGLREWDIVNDFDLICYYWSSTPYEGNEEGAYSMYIAQGVMDMSETIRGNGHAVRLVR